MQSLRRSIGCLGAIVCLSAGFGSEANAGTLTVVSQDPPARSGNNPVVTPIRVTFDQPVLPGSVTALSFSAYGRWSGPASGAYSFSNGNQTVTLTPTRPFTAGESVMVVLSHDLQAADLSFLRSAGYSYHFFIRSRGAAMNFATIDTMSNLGPDPQTRIYGASASDLDLDGWMDLTTVNEVSADLRVFMNKADGSGLYDPYLTPPFPIGVESSPNEPADFDRDGFPDLAIAASSDNSAWIVLGNGDGTFSSSQEIAVGSTPHGIAVLDVDGDGDMDVVTSNTGTSNVSLMLNNGSGVFGAATSFEGGGSGEYGLFASDMNNDGIMDLVVGARNSEEIIIQRGNGNGTFTPITTQDAGGSVWMITCADVNGDGNMDVTTANSTSNNGSILFGDGTGGLSLPTTYSTASHVVATDIGDLDGDGDADWILASFGGGRWRVFKNNGTGVFTFDQEFIAPSNPSCAVILDFDNDRDLDLALTDEIADVMILKKNSGTALFGDFDNDGNIDGDDYTSFAGCFGGTGVDAGLTCQSGDFDGDGDVDCFDWVNFQAAWTAGGGPPSLPQCASAPVPAISRNALFIACAVLLIAGGVVFGNLKKRILPLED